MKEGTRRGLWAAALLYGLFAAVYLLVAFPKPSKPKPIHTWAAPRTLVSDSIIYSFVQELISQSNEEFSSKIDEFHIEKVLLNRRPDITGRGHLYPQVVLLDNSIMQKLYTEYKLLTQKDTLFMRRQQAYSGGFQWKQQLLSGFTVLSADTLQSIRARDPFKHMQIIKRLYQQHKTLFFSFISTPLFSCDGRTVIIELSYVDGIHDGGGEIWVLQRRQNKWKKVLLLDEWQS